MKRALELAVPLLAALVVTVSPASSFAQPQRQISGQGTEGFRALIATYGLKPLRDLRELNEEPERTLLIAFRGAEARGRDPLDNLPVRGGVAGFVRRGGAILYASDQPKRSGWVDDFSVTIDGTKLFGEAKDCYDGRDYCPFAVGSDTVKSPLFQRRGPREFDRFGLREQGLRVATNRPSYLVRSTMPALATYDVPLRRENRFRPYTFAEGQNLDNGGKILVLADHSVFINDMLLPPEAENDNFAFAANCLDWLTVGPGLQKRDRVLFIDQNGEIETNFNLALMAVPPPMPKDFPGLLDLLWANRDLLWEHRDKLVDLEDSGFFAYLSQSNFFNDLLLAWQPHWVWVRFAVVLATLALLFLGIRRFLGSRFRRAKNVSRLAVALDRYRPRVGVLEQRLRSARSRGQAFEAAREKARQFFADFEMTPAGFGQTLPEFTVEAGWWKRRALSRDLREVWRIAYGEEPVPVRTRHWPAYLARLQNLRQAIRKGMIRFA